MKINITLSIKNTYTFINIFLFKLETKNTLTF